MKVAIFSPLNPVSTGISDYTEEMLFEFEKYFDFELFIDQSYKPETKEIRTHFPITPYDPQTFNPSQYDEIIYHMGNFYAGHRYIYEALKSHPGIVVLHDYVLQGFYAERYAETGNFEEYRQLLKKYYTEKGEEIAQDIARGMPMPIWETEKAFEFPLNEEILEYAKALIVHSHFIKKRLEKMTKRPIAKINPHGYRTKTFDIEKTRRELGIKDEEILICSAGFVNKNKRYEIVIQALMELNDPRIKYVLAGKDKGSILANILKGTEKNIMVRGHLPLAELERLISASDICINLRYPTMGESSGSLLRMMGYGKPTLVTDYGSYAEFPDYCVLKICPDIDEKELVRRFVKALIDDKEFRLSVGREAKTYVEKECSIEKCTGEYVRFIKELKYHRGI